MKAKGFKYEKMKDSLKDIYDEEEMDELFQNDEVDDEEEEDVSYDVLSDPLKDEARKTTGIELDDI